jgi:hypothetical protein
MTGIISSTISRVPIGPVRAQALLEVLAFEQLHDQERPAALHAHVQHLDDVRVVYRRRGAPLAQHLLHGLSGRGQRHVHDLDGHPLAQLDVTGLEDLAHPAPSQMANELVGSEAR